MMSMNTAALPVSNAYERSNPDSSANADASTRARYSMNDVGSADNSASANAAQTKTNDAARTAAIAKLSQADTSIPDPVQMMSTLAVVNAGLGSTPATLALMTDIAVATGSGTLSDADRTAMQVQYAQLSQQFTATVGAASAGAQMSSSKDQDDRDADAGANSQSSDDHRTTLTRTSDAQAPQYVQHEPLEQLVTTTKMVQVDDNSEPRRTPVVSLLRHELHVGTDSYEPVAVKQTMTRASRPAEFAEVEQQSTTHRISVAQVTQIRQLSEVAQVQLVSVLA